MKTQNNQNVVASTSYNVHGAAISASRTGMVKTFTPPPFTNKCY
jgi:hypothetical protein